MTVLPLDSRRAGPGVSPRPDAELLAAVARGEGPALGELARRYVDFVYAAAVRQLNDPHAAEDVTQAVFLVLAKKAARVRPPALAAWLHRTTVYAAANARRAARRRRRHELAAAKPEADMPADPTQDLLARLDSAIAGLSAKDRIAVCNRYLRGDDLAGVAAALGATPAAAQKRIERAVDTLRRRLGADGRASRDLGTPAASAAVLAALALAAPSPASAAPPALATAIAAASPAATSIAKGVIVMTLSSKAKTVAAVAAALLLGGVGLEGVRRLAATPAAGPAATVPASIDPALVGRWQLVQETFGEDGVLDPGLVAGRSIEIDADGHSVMRSSTSPDDPARLVAAGAAGEIDLVASDGKRHRGRYAIDGDRLRLRYANQSDAGPRPAPFDVPNHDRDIVDAEFRRVAPAGGPLVATFADGVTTELLAVGDAAADEWWTPDGRPTPRPAGSRQIAPPPGLKPTDHWLTFVTATRGPSGAAFDRGRVVPEAKVSGGWTSWPAGERRLTTVIVPGDTRMVDWHTDVAAEPPRTATLKPDNAGKWDGIEITSPSGKTYRLSDAADRGGKAEVVLRPHTGGWEADAVDVEMLDADGRNVVDFYTPFGRVGNMALRCQADRPLAALGAARLTLRHYDRWAEFRGVAVRAGAAAMPTIETSEAVAGRTAVFADGVSVELIAIGEKDTGQWWTPDGRPVPRPAGANTDPVIGPAGPGRRRLSLITEIRGNAGPGTARGRIEPPPADRAPFATWAPQLQGVNAQRDQTDIVVDAAAESIGYHLDVAPEVPQSVTLWRGDGPWDAAAAVEITSPGGQTYRLSRPHPHDGRPAFDISPYDRDQYKADQLTLVLIGPGGEEWPCMLEPVEGQTPAKLEAWSSKWTLPEVTTARLKLRRFDRGADFLGVAARPGDRASPRAVVRGPAASRDPAR